MEELIDQIRTDKELNEMRVEWAKYAEPYTFPPFHFETYAGFDQYKEDVRVKLERLKEG